MLKWRLGTKVPINVYEGDRPVCQCHTAEDAKVIVRAVNEMNQRNEETLKAVKRIEENR